MKQHVTQQMQLWRQQSLDLIFRSIFVFLVFALILPIQMAFASHMYWRIVVFVVTLSLAALATFYHHIPYRLKAALLLLLIYTQGIQGFFMSAGAGDAFLFLLVIPFVGGFLLGPRSSINLLVFVALTLVLFGGLFVSGTIIPENAFAVPAALNFMSWASRIPVFIILALLLILPQGWLVRKLTSALNSAYENETKYRTLAEDISDIIFMLDSKGRINYMSPVIESILGQPASAFIDRHFIDFIDEEDVGTVQTAWERGISPDQPATEFRITTGTGEQHWFRTKLKPIQENDKISGYRGVLVDITSLKQAEIRVTESEEKFRAIFEQAYQFIGLLKPDGRVISANQTALNFLKLSESDVKDEPFWDTPWFRHSESEREKLRQSIKKTAEGQFIRYETTHQDLGGELHHIDFSLIPILDSHNTVKWILPEGRDITDIKNLQEAIRTSELRFRSYFDSNPDGIVLFDLQGRIIEINRRSCLLSGYPKDKLLGKHFSELISPEYYEELRKEFEESKSGITTDNPFQMNFTTENGSNIFISIQGWLVTDPESKPVAFGVFVKDLSVEKKLLEEKILLEQQLQQAQKMEAIGTLAGGIAHDFNNILSGIIGYTELALGDIPENSKTRERLTRVLDAGGRASELVSQILQFSRKETNALMPTSLTSLLEEAIKLMRSTLPSTIEIHQNITAKEDRIMADATKLHQVIMNLCTNAYQAMRNQGGILSIELKNVFLAEPRQCLSTQIPPGEYLQLLVTDTGHGIAPESCNRIFEPYFSTKKSEGGTGLGLAVSLGIIQDHQGLIELDRSSKEGTTISIYLPITRGEKITAETNEVSGPRGNGERILIVDDEAIFLDVIWQHLVDFGYHVTSFQNSSEALAAIKSDPKGYDLILTDLTMPGMTGIQLAAEVRKFNTTIPFILCTGFSETLTEQSIVHYGISKLLLKPMKRNTLTKAVHDSLKKTRL